MAETLKKTLRTMAWVALLAASPAGAELLAALTAVAAAPPQLEVPTRAEARRVAPQRCYYCPLPVG